MSSDLSYDLTGWAAGPEGAVRVQIRMAGDHDLNEEIDVMRQASAIYRRTYHEWATDTGHSHERTSAEALETQAKLEQPLRRPDMRKPG